MTPVLADILNISINVLLVIHVLVCLLLALVVLMQRPKQEGLGAAFGGGLTDQAFGAQTTNVLQKGTVWLGTMFFVITLILAILIGKRQNRSIDMTDTSTATTEEVTPAVPTDLEKDKPVTEEVTMPGSEENKPAAETPAAVPPPAAPDPVAPPTPPAGEQPEPTPAENSGE